MWTIYGPQYSVPFPKFLFGKGSLWVINEVSNTNKHLRIIDKKNQYNVRTAEETTSLVLVFCSSKKARHFSSVFWCKINLDQKKWSLGITQNLN